MGDERETTEQAEAPQRSSASSYQTAVRWLTSGAPNRYTRIGRNRITLGRDAGADVRLEASGISREHAEIHRQGSVYAISDKGSRNGTFVNGERVRHRALAHNDVLHLGALLGVVLRLPASFDLDAEDVLRIDGVGVFGPGLYAEMDALRRVAGSTLPVVVVGETGVGKESIARALHTFSGRTGPFHAVNCAALPLGLAEAELFGHKKGAFTGAEQAGLGHFRAAHGGTLFLDEIADLPAPIQAKLLRALQDSKVTPLGETRAVEVDVRIVTACQVALEELVREKRLREDLMMRLGGLTVALAPLRLRRVDAGLLLDHFLGVWGETGTPLPDPWALEALLLHPWPGNARELELCVRSLIALHRREPVIRPNMLPAGMVRASATAARASNARQPPDQRPRADDDLTRLVESLRTNGGRVADAAKAIGISRQRAYRLMRGRRMANILASTPEPAPDAALECEPNARHDEE